MPDVVALCNFFEMDKDNLSLHALFVVNARFVLCKHFRFVLHFYLFFVATLDFISILQLHPKIVHLSRISKYAPERKFEGILCSPKGSQLLTPWVRMIKSKLIFKSPVVCLFLHTFLLKLHGAQISTEYYFGNIMQF